MKYHTNTCKNCFFDVVLINKDVKNHVVSIKFFSENAVKLFVCLVTLISNTESKRTSPQAMRFCLNNQAREVDFLFPDNIDLTKCSGFKIKVRDETNRAQFVIYFPFDKSEERQFQPMMYMS